MSTQGASLLPQSFAQPVQTGVVVFFRKEAGFPVVPPLHCVPRFTLCTRGTTAKRAALWCFREIETLRRTLIQRAGRIIRPAGKVILSMNSNEKLENELLHSLGLLKALGA